LKYNPQRNYTVKDKHINTLKPLLTLQWDNKQVSIFKGQGLAWLTYTNERYTNGNLVHL